MRLSASLRGRTRASTSSTPSQRHSIQHQLEDLGSRCRAIGFSTCVNDTFTFQPIWERGRREDENKVHEHSLDLRTMCRQKRLNEVMQVLHRMDQEGLQLQSDIVAVVLQLCASLKALLDGKQLHSLITRSGASVNSFICNNLLTMYAKCGSLSDAKQVFDEMPARDVVSWNAMITGYTENGLEEAVVALFWHMQQRRMEPNKVTFICVLKACAPPLSLDQGQQIHIHIVGHGFDTDVVVGSAMVDMYVRFRSIHDAREVFENMTTQDVTLWTSIITGYAQYGHSEEALKLFQQMLHEGVRPDRVIFLSVLRACASLPAMHQGLKIHALIFASGFELDAFVGSALVDMYAKCGSLQHACQVFDKLPIQDVVSWTALISGYVQQGLSEDALFFFCKMKHAGIRPNEVTFVSALSACSPLAAIEQGKLIHLDILKSSSESNLFVASALIDMYAKCGSIDHACSVFRKISNRDIVVWNTMIDGYAQHGNAEAAFQLFEQMNKSGLKMDTFTFVGVLSACNHAGLVDEGWHYFHSMSRDHGIRPSTEHYACIVDILGRAGHLEEANKMVQSISSEHSSSVQMSLLSACRIHGNVELAKNVAMSLFELEPQNEVAYVLLSNVYSASARWQDTAVVRQMMKESGFEKELVQSCRSQQGDPCIHHRSMTSLNQ